MTAHPFQQQKTTTMVSLDTNVETKQQMQFKTVLQGFEDHRE
jgi:hypothetical protein